MAAAAVLLATSLPVEAQDPQVADIGAHHLTDVLNGSSPAASTAATPGAVLTTAVLQAYIARRRAQKGFDMFGDPPAQPQLTSAMVSAYADTHFENAALAAIDGAAATVPLAETFSFEPTSDATIRSVTSSITDDALAHYIQRGYVPTMKRVEVADHEKKCLSTAIYNEARGESVDRGRQRAFSFAAQLACMHHLAAQRIELRTDRLALLDQRFRLAGMSRAALRNRRIDLGHACGDVFGLLGGNRRRFAAALFDLGDKQSMRLCKLSVDCLCLVSGRRPSAEQLAVARRAQVARIVERHCADSALTPDAIARALGVSRRTLYLLTADLGGLADYIRTIRVLRALDLLQDPACELSLQEIARLTGFPSPKAMSRALVRLVGDSPGRLRCP